MAKHQRNQTPLADYQRGGEVCVCVGGGVPDTN